MLIIQKNKKILSKKLKVKKGVSKLTSFRPLILSRHPSHSPLRTSLPRLPFRSVIRLGSTTVKNDYKRVEINSVQGVKNSSNKRLMKQCFNKANVKTADWYTFKIQNNDVILYDNGNTNNTTFMDEIEFPLIVKHVYGSRGTGNYLAKSVSELKSCLSNKNSSDYIIEKYYNFNREYRIHVTRNGYFYACRKMLKSDTPENKKFQRHDDNCVWYIESNPKFDKPVNWNNIVNDCVNALNALQLDICCFDIKVQSAKDKKGLNRPNPNYILIESGSAPSFGELTLVKYIEVLPNLIKQKYNEHF